MKKVILLILFPFIVSAQFTKNDSSLVYTTFTREFDKKVINSYLTSGNEQKVKAALLSISHSSDSSFVNEIIRLDFSKYGSEICFSLGQLGPNSFSEGFLLSKLNSNNVSSPLLQALGKCGSKNSFEFILQKYFSSEKNFDGISLALYNFNVRGLLDKPKAIPVLLNELRNKSLSEKRQSDAAFAIYRINLAAELKDVLTSEIKYDLVNGDSSEAAVNKMFYIISSLRLIKSNVDKELFYALTEVHPAIIKIEAAKLLSHSTYLNNGELNSYLNFFNDADPNLTRTAAASLKDLKLNAELSAYLRSWIEEKIKAPHLSAYTKGELLNSYIALYTSAFDSMNVLFSNVLPSFTYQAAEQAKSEPALSYLLGMFSNESNKNKLRILQSLLVFQEGFRNNRTLQSVLLNAAGSDNAPLISIAAEGIDSLFIIEHSDSLREIVNTQAHKYMNNPDYAEAMISLYVLAERIDSAFAISVLNTLKNSEIFFVKGFASNKLSNENKIVKNGRLFAGLWDYSFKYSSAEIQTSKGSFRIKFLPQYAPVSVGNFCSLASNGFFNGVLFHRVVPAFVIQGGDSTGTGWGGPGYDIISETSFLEYTKGMVGMASSGKDTEGSQWFVTTGYYPHLNGRYSIFAEVTGGIDTIYEIDQDDRIESIQLIQ